MWLLTSMSWTISRAILSTHTHTHTHTHCLCLLADIIVLLNTHDVPALSLSPQLPLCLSEVHLGPLVHKNELYFHWEEGWNLLTPLLLHFSSGYSVRSSCKLVWQAFQREAAHTVRENSGSRGLSRVKMPPFHYPCDMECQFRHECTNISIITAFYEKISTVSICWLSLHYSAVWDH